MNESAAAVSHSLPGMTGVFCEECPSLGVTDNAVRTPSPPSHTSVNAFLTESKGGMVRARFIIWRSEQRKEMLTNNYRESIGVFSFWGRARL